MMFGHLSKCTLMTEVKRVTATSSARQSAITPECETCLGFLTNPKTGRRLSLENADKAELLKFMEENENHSSIRHARRLAECKDQTKVKP